MVSGSSSSGSSELGSSDKSHPGSPAGSHTGSPVPSKGSSSSGSECSQSASPEVVKVPGDEDIAAGGEDADHLEDEEALSQGTASLLNISNSDNEEAHKAAVRKTVCKSNVQYGTWWDEQIHQGNEGISQHNKQVNDYADSGQPRKVPDKIGPPLSYMEERGVFKPLDSIANPKGLCQFYRTDPEKSNVIMGLKSAASTCSIKRLLDLAKELGHPLTIVVFEGGTVTLLGLLQELHLHLTLSCIPIHTPQEAKIGQNNCVSCCPICVYVIKNDNAFLNHVIIGHYWSSFSCGKCLDFVASSGQQMKKHFPKCSGPRDTNKWSHSKSGKSSGLGGDDKGGKSSGL